MSRLHDSRRLLFLFGAFGVFAGLASAQAPVLQISAAQPAAPCGGFPASACVTYDGASYTPSDTLTFQVTSSGAPLDFTASTSIISPAGGNWLAIDTPVPQTTPDSVTVSIDASQLPAGTYLAYLILTSSSAGNSPLNIPILLTAPAAQFQVNSQTVSFGNINAPTTNNSIQVTDSGPQPVSFTVATATVDNGNWLTVTAGNGSTTPSQLSITVDPTGLPPASYVGYVVLSPNDGSSAALVAVSFTVGFPALQVSSPQPAAQCNFFPAAACVTVNGNSYDPANQLTFQVGSGAGLISFAALASATSPAPFNTWLTIAGTTLNSVTVQIDASQLPLGTYLGYLILTSPYVSNSPLFIPLGVTVFPTAAFQAKPQSISFGTITGPQTDSSVNVTDQPATDGPNQQLPFSLSFSTSDGAQWLSATASNNSSTPSQLSVNVDPTGLPAGNYLGYVTLSPNDASSGAIVAVTFTTAGPPPPGTIQVNAMLNGVAWTGAVSYQLNGPNNQNGANVPFSYPGEGPGSYTLSNVSGGPAGATLVNITPSATQTLSSGGTITFTLNFTAPTTGTVQVNATLNGSAWSGSVSYQLSGPTGQNGASVPASYASETAGSYTLSYVSGGPAGATLANITPPGTQTLTTGGTITFTLDFTAPTTGTIQVHAMLNGTAWTGAVSYQLSGPRGQSGSSVPASYNNETTGSYTLSNVSGGPAGATLASITPSATQTLTAGGTITFTLNFTAPTTGTIQVSATLNGTAWTGAVSYQLSGPSGQSGSSVPASYNNETAGSYTLAYSSGGPAGATLANITPPGTQTLTTGGTITFTLNFTAPTTGTIQVHATLNGSAWSGSVSYHLTGPSGQTGTSVPASYSSESAGSYTLASVSGGPLGATLANITPSATQTLNSGATITFTLNFTAACVYTVSPSSVYLDSESQAAQPVSVTAGPGCAWSASSTGGFMTITAGATGSGNGVVTFAVGSNSTGADLAGTLLVAGHTVPVTQRGTRTIFTDVTPPAYYFDFTNVLSQTGITGGCATSPPQYCPNANITRGEMAVFIVLAAEGGSTFNYNPAPYFSDVPATSPYFKFIQKLKELGITSGCSATMYCPDESVTRAEMAVFIIVARYESTPYTYPATPYFTDVPATNPFFPFVQKMAQVGITAGCGPNLYCPNETLTRGQMSVFIVTGLLNELLGPAAPVVTAAIPSQASPGQGITVTLTGLHTHFADGVTHVATAPYLTATNVQVSSETTLTVQLAVSGSATQGPTSIVVTTGTEEAVLPNGFTVQ